MSEFLRKDGIIDYHRSIRGIKDLDGAPNEKIQFGAEMNQYDGAIIADHDLSKITYSGSVDQSTCNLTITGSKGHGSGNSLRQDSEKGNRVVIKDNYCVIVVKNSYDTVSGDNERAGGHFIYKERYKETTSWLAADISEDVLAPTAAEIDAQEDNDYNLQARANSYTIQDESQNNYIDVTKDRVVVGYSNVYASAAYTPGSAVIYTRTAANTWNKKVIVSPVTSPSWVDYGRAVATDGDFVAIAMENNQTDAGRIFLHKHTGGTNYTLQQTITRTSAGGAAKTTNIAMSKIIAANGDVIHWLAVGDATKSPRRLEIYKSVNGANFTNTQNFTENFNNYWAESMCMRGSFLIVGGRANGAANPAKAIIYHYDGESDQWVERKEFTPTDDGGGSDTLWYQEGTHVTINKLGHCVLANPFGGGGGAANDYDGNIAVYMNQNPSGAPANFSWSLSAHLRSHHLDGDNGEADWAVDGTWTPSFGKAIAIDNNSIFAYSSGDTPDGGSANENTWRAGALYVYETRNTMSESPGSFRFLQKSAANIRGQTASKSYKIFSS